MLRFLHLADVHLGLRVTRFSERVVELIREARYQSLENVRDRVLRDPARQIDFVIIAGDLFDDGQVTGVLANRAAHLLNSFPVPVLLIPGNHDPYEPGNVWDFEQWKAAREPGTGALRLFTARTPVTIPELPTVDFFPCPVFRRNSLEDPTAWISSTAERRDREKYRIGIAHGSVMLRPNLPEDDHPIALDSVTRSALDYLALGHWHNPLRLPDRDGAIRMAYAGVPESTRFSSTTSTTGWEPYSAASAADLFLDQGGGEAYQVTIPEPGAPPQLESLSVGQLKWIERTHDLRPQDSLGDLIDNIATAVDKERSLLRLTLTGTVSLAALSQLDVIQQTLGRYVHAEFDRSRLFVEPTAAELEQTFRGGLAGTVYERLRQESPGAGEPAEIARTAIELLYKHLSSIQ